MDCQTQLVKTIGYSRNAAMFAWNILQRGWRQMLLPFRLVAEVWRFAAALGVRIVRLTVDLLTAALGITFVLFVGYCLARAFLYPIFRGH